MKFLIIFVLLVGLVASRKFSGRWASYSARFLKKDESKDVTEERYKKFEKNVETIDEQNEKYLNGTSTFYVDTNQFSGLFDNEIKSRKGFIPLNISTAEARQKREVIMNSNIIFRTGGQYAHPFKKKVGAPVNTAKDWTTVWTRAPEDQGQCGSCWTFASTAVIDASYKIKKSIDIQTSKQELLDCSKSLGTLGCDGGSQANAFEYAMAKGLGIQSSYAYKGAVGNTCLKSGNTYKISTFAVVDPDEEALRQAIDELGVCTVSIDTDDKLLQQYKGGVYDGACSSNPAAIDHAVTLVGYGVDSVTKVPFWKIRNSWGATWGEAGHIRIKRGVNKCGITTYAYCVVL